MCKKNYTELKKQQDMGATQTEINEEEVLQEKEVEQAATAEGAEETAAEEATAEETAAEEVKAEPTAEEKLAQLEEELAKEKKEYLFLMADFDNFRKRTLKEKAELIRNGGEKVLGELLPVLDDFERALQAINSGNDVDSLKEGVNLIYGKFVQYLEKNQVKEIISTDADFDTELHDAVTTFPVDDESKKGKVIDTVQKGYMINDKVLRHAKVVVGQ